MLLENCVTMLGCLMRTVYKYGIDVADNLSSIITYSSIEQSTQ